MPEKEIGKLLELLNEYEKEKEKSEGTDVEKYILFSWDKNYKGDIVRYDECDTREGDNLQTNEAITYLISKSFGFIQRLVEQDKIDESKINLNDYEIEIRIRAVKELLSDSEEKTVLYLKLLMLLSISEQPIDDLISYLK